MFRYISLIWDPLNPDQATAARVTEQRLRHTSADCPPALAWQCVCDTPGLKVFCASIGERVGKEYRMCNGAGVLVGTVFRKPLAPTTDPRAGDAARVSEFDEPETERALTSGGESLIESYWGDYAAFLRLHSGRVRVLRSPMCALPVYKFSFRGVHVVFSRLADLVALDIATLTINWDYVRKYMLSMYAPRVETGLNGVIELQRGWVWDISRERCETADLWNPLQLAASNLIESSTDAERELRAKVKTCTRTWASCFDRILLRLSGGLDSSIVAGCLRDSPTAPTVVCMNVYTRGADSDERAYARLVAEHCGFRLVEVPYHENVSVEPMLSANPFPFPPQTINYLCAGAEESSLVARERIQAVLDGHDGDGLFGRTISRFSVTDYVCRHGFRPGVVPIAADVARFEGRTIWRTLYWGIKQSLQQGFDPFHNKHGDARKLLSHEILESRNHARPFERWLSEARRRGIPPGKTYHAHQICSVTSGFYHAFGDDLEQPHLVSPFCSQPVIETMLRIPTYVLTSFNGLLLDRPLARRAFANDLPNQIAYRRDKGAVSDYSATLIRRNIGFMRQTLLDGILLRERFVDRTLLEDALSETPASNQPGSMQLFWLMSIEAWLRTFDRACIRAAA